MNIKILKDISQKNLSKIVIDLNINSIKQEFDSLIEITIENNNIRMVSEVNTDESFPKCQFLIKRFSEP